MSLYLSRTHHAQLLKWANEAAPQECCGLLLGSNMIVSTIEKAENVAVDPHTYFEIDPVTLIKAQKQMRVGGPDIIGYFHSHPNGLDRPSATDADHAVADGKYWLIIADNKISAWLPVSEHGAATGFLPVILTVQG
jgi:desampylase